MANQIQGDYVAGHCTAAWAATSLGSSAGSFVTIGSTEEGFTIERTFHEEEIHDDRFGQAVADTVQEGVDYRVSGVLLNIAVVTTAGVLNTQEGEGLVNTNCGLLGSSIYGTLVLTPVAGTTAAKAIGAGNSYVFYLCAIGNSVSYLLGNKHRKIPVSFRCLPDPANSFKAYAIVANPAGIPVAFPGTITSP